MVSPPDPAGLGSGDLMLEPVRIGDRTVRRPYGDTTGPVDLMVWLDATASDADVEAVRTFLADSSLVHSSTYKGQDAMWAEFQRAYADQPQVLDVVEADDLPTAFEVDLEVDDSTSIAELQSELQAFSGVTMATPGAAFERYEWDEAGATIVVDGSHGSGSAVEAVVAGLTVTPQDDQPPFVTMTNLPDGWVVLAGPSAPTADPVPVLNFLYGTGNGSLNVTRQPSFDVQHPLIPVTVGGRAGYLTEPEGQGFTLTWALEEEGWWAQLVGYGASRDQALALAEAVTFTDKADWSSLYPLEASTATTSALSPPTTTATTEP